MRIIALVLLDWVWAESKTTLRRAGVIDGIVSLLEKAGETQQVNSLKLLLLKATKKQPEFKAFLGDSFDMMNFIHSVSHEVVARHLNAIEWEFFSGIEIKEIALRAWQGSKRRTTAPTLTKMAERFDNVSYWVASQILKYKQAKEQSQIITFYIKVLNDLYKFHNFNTLMMILSGLNMSVVQRLKLAWNEVSSKQREAFDNIDDLMCPLANMKKYREHLTALEQAENHEPVIPYVAMYLRDVTYVFDGNADFNVKGKKTTINFSKLQLLGNQLARLKAYQTQKGFREFILEKDKIDPNVQEVLTGLPETIYDEEQLYSMSLECSPITSQVSQLDLSEVTSTDSSDAKSPDRRTNSARKASPDSPLYLFRTKSNDTANSLPLFDNNSIVKKPTGEVLQTSNKLYVIGSGKVQCKLAKDDSPVYSFSAGSILGECPLFSAQCDYEYKVTEDASLKEMYIPEIEAKLAEDPQLAVRFYQLIGKQLANQVTELRAAKQGDNHSSPSGKSFRYSKRGATIKKRILKKKTLPEDVVFEQFQMKVEVVYHSPATLTSPEGARSGTIYLSHDFLFFYSNLFNSALKRIIGMAEIESHNLESDGIVITTDKKKTYKIACTENHNSTFYDRLSECHTVSTSGLFGNEKVLSTQEDEKTASGPLSMTQDDWGHIVGSSSDLQYSFEPDEVIISQGCEKTTMYQIVLGSCRVLVNGKPVSTLEEGQVFGEFQFITGHPANATVIAKEATLLNGISLSRVSELYKTHPQSVARFYHHLCTVMESRVHVVMQN